MIFEQLWNNCQFWNCISFRMAIFLVACLQLLQTLCSVYNSRIPNLGHMSELEVMIPYHIYVRCWALMNLYYVDKCAEYTLCQHLPKICQNVHKCLRNRFRITRYREPYHNWGLWWSVFWKKKFFLYKTKIFNFNLLYTLHNWHTTLVPLSVWIYTRKDNLAKVKN